MKIVDYKNKLYSFETDLYLGKYPKIYKSLLESLTTSENTHEDVRGFSLPSILCKKSSKVLIYKNYWIFLDEFKQVLKNYKYCTHQYDEMVIKYWCSDKFVWETHKEFLYKEWTVDISFINNLHRDTLFKSCEADIKHVLEKDTGLIIEKFIPNNECR